MISPAASTAVPIKKAAAVLVRYGAVPRVVRCSFKPVDEQNVHRGTAVVVSTDRGQELGKILEVLPPSLAEGHEPAEFIERIATAEDCSLHVLHQQQSADLFDIWQQRILDWQLEMELIDVEKTLDDQMQILYVLNGRGAETTRLALLAAAAGLGIVSVQPVTSEGLEDGAGGGCGTGCGCNQ